MSSVCCSREWCGYTRYMCWAGSAATQLVSVLNMHADLSWLLLHPPGVCCSCDKSS